MRFFERKILDAKLYARLGRAPAFCWPMRKIASCMLLLAPLAFRTCFQRRLTVQAMDSPVVNYIFRQLSLPSRRCLHSRPFAPLRQTPREQQCRTYVLRRSQDDGQGGSRWQQRIDAFPKDISKQLREYPKLTASDLRYRSQRPRRVKMLARDFIEGWEGYSALPCVLLMRARQPL